MWWNRDKTKRPSWRKPRATYSDKVILTSDNPRTEDPGQILKDMQKGYRVPQKKIHRMADRREAIKTAVSFANKEISFGGR